MCGCCSLLKNGVLHAYRSVPIHNPLLQSIVRSHRNWYQTLFAHELRFAIESQLVPNKANTRTPICDGIATCHKHCMHPNSDLRSHRSWPQASSACIRSRICDRIATCHKHCTHPNSDLRSNRNMSKLSHAYLRSNRSSQGRIPCTHASSQQQCSACAYCRRPIVEHPARACGDGWVYCRECWQVHRAGMHFGFEIWILCIYMYKYGSLMIF